MAKKTPISGGICPTMLFDSVYTRYRKYIGLRGEIHAMREIKDTQRSMYNQEKQHLLTQVQIQHIP